MRTRALLSMTATAVLLMGLTACGNDDASDTVAHASSTTSQTPAPTASSVTASPTEKPELIGYAGGESPGVTVQKRADTRKLDGAPASFKKFIGDLAEKVVSESSCDSAAVGITVETLRTDGYAVGGVNDCGGYQALWAIVDGHWKEIFGTQDTWDCAVLKRYTVPSDVVGETCYAYHGDHQEHHYHQA